MACPGLICDARRPAGSGPTPLSAHIADCFASASDCVVHCVFYAVWRGTDKLDLFVDVVTHERIKSFRGASGEHIPRSKEPDAVTGARQLESKMHLNRKAASDRISLIRWQ
jgi:hypothetical protein